MNQHSEKNLMELAGNPLIGKTKKQIIEVLGDGFNFYPENVWYYVLGKTWYGRKKVLFIKFQNDIVTYKVIKGVYGKISTAGVCKNL